MGIGARDYTAAGSPGAKGNRLGQGLAPVDVLPSYAGPTADARPRRDAGYSWQADPRRTVRRRRQVGAKPSADQLHYAHLAGQNIVLWGGLIVFLILFSRRHHRTRLLHGLAHKVAG